ncbi:Agmatine coumaroyltransferase [Forsythia ovata]|uniref:Agmatine coumaroyltransferase n=1 Tax=Forsythia ovata TaxID=205694 RepID=A0ABD1X040_9LAMI
MPIGPSTVGSPRLGTLLQRKRKYLVIISLDLASINRFNGDTQYCSLPSFDRTNVQDLNGLDSLKKLVLAKRPSAAHVSSFTVTCALVWVCFAKSAASSGKAAVDDDVEYFTFVADCRARLNPPLPPTYFGNCVALVIKAKLNHGELKGNDGILVAAESIGQAIQKSVFNEKGILHDAHNWLAQFEETAGKKTFAVGGSPRFDIYDVDYGWGRPKKFEGLFIDDSGAISLCKSREADGSLEIGLSGTKIYIDSFATAIIEFLGNLLP